VLDFISDYVGSNAFLGFVIEGCHHKLLFVSLPLTFSVSDIINDYIFNVSPVFKLPIYSDISSGNIAAFYTFNITTFNIHLKDKVGASTLVHRRHGSNPRIKRNTIWYST